MVNKPVVFIILLVAIGISILALYRSIILAKKLGEEDGKKKRAKNVHA